MYLPILLAWTWLLLSTTHAFAIDRSPNLSSRSTSARFDDDLGLFKRGPGGDNGGDFGPKSATGPYNTKSQPRSQETDVNRPIPHPRTMVDGPDSGLLRRSIDPPPQPSPSQTGTSNESASNTQGGLTRTGRTGDSGFHPYLRRQARGNSDSGSSWTNTIPAAFDSRGPNHSTQTSSIPRPTPGAGR